ncbi:unnamed protein product [Acanthoscelides obtectus]|uniref:Uncharacterized protein n=1 Tax=Acanthoscelides obtectus TaxID=200917 RepID=A0A9P0LCI4_ACAOB|nr:unnamed protein product [Acanthoscelides obtectus]CAK1662821.1 hypothetical protein AOBTE_LOCUS23334 [Acanthoscelides obtectus]
MSKRNRSFENSSNKKHKLDDDIDALWGDDLDETALDVCIKLATQAFEEEKVCTQNTSLRPYSFFQRPDEIFASTQINSKPSTSKAFSTFTDIQSEDINLRQKYEEKEGEVAILRSQIKEIKVTHNIKQQKIQNEWKHRLSGTEKEVQSIKSELEFKNLEIANLKQQLSVLAKCKISTLPATNNANDTTLLRHNSSKEIKEIPTLRTCSLYGSPLIAFPLKDVLCDGFLNAPKKEKHTIKTKVINPCRNAIPYLQNRTISLRTIVEETSLEISHIMSSVYALIGSSESDLDSDESIGHIDRLIWATYELLNSFKGLLNAIKLNLRTEDLLGSDSNYLNNGGSGFSHSTDCSYEVGKKAGVLMQFFSILVCHSHYAKKYFCKQSGIKWSDSLRGLVRVQGITSITGNDMLEKILKTVKLIGEIRLSDITPTFLASSINLFVSLCKIGCCEFINDVFCEFTKETIFLRASHDIVFQLTYLFREASLIPSFSEFLFNKAKANSTNTKGVIYFSNDACRFYIYAMQFENASNQVGTLPLNITLNMLSFMYNTYKSAYWIHHTDIKGCDCLAQLYKLVMDIIFKALESYKKIKKKCERQKSKETHCLF